MSLNYYQRPSTIQQTDVSSEEEDNLETINKSNNKSINNDVEIKRKSKSTKEIEEDKSDSVSHSEDFEEYKKKMKQKSKKSVFQKIYKCLVIDILKKTLFQCINCCFELICCDDDCIDKSDCMNIESCNEDGICDCGFDDDDCC